MFKPFIQIQFYVVDVCYLLIMRDTCSVPSRPLYKFVLRRHIVKIHCKYILYHVHYLMELNKKSETCFHVFTDWNLKMYEYHLQLYFQSLYNNTHFISYILDHRVHTNLSTLWKFPFNLNGHCLKLHGTDVYYNV